MPLNPFAQKPRNPKTYRKRYIMCKETKIMITQIPCWKKCQQEETRATHL